MSRVLRGRRPPRRLPKYLHVRWFALRRFANSIAAFYGAPVFLVGSALRPGNIEPRDVDIRVMLPDDVFEQRFGSVRRWEDEAGTGAYSRVRWRWSDECVKRTRQACGETSLNVDFQIYPRSHAHALYRKKPRVRLDTRGRRR